VIQNIKIGGDKSSKSGKDGASANEDRLREIEQEVE